MLGLPSIEGSGILIVMLLRSHLILAEILIFIFFWTYQYWADRQKFALTFYFWYYKNLPQFYVAAL